MSNLLAWFSILILVVCLYLFIQGLFDIHPHGYEDDEDEEDETDEEDEFDEMAETNEIPGAKEPPEGGLK